jgi:ketosteroid isomerase-like protein
MKATITLLITAIIISSCSQQTKVDTEAEGEKLMQISRDWSDLAKTRNIDTILNAWADDAVMMAPGLPPLKGKAAIRKYVEEGMKVPGFSIRWEPLEVFVSKGGDMAYMIERNEIIINDSLGNPVPGYNKTVTVWRKQTDGSWKNVIDMWNADPTGNF